MASTLNEYEKNKELNKDDVKYLTEWINKQPHLPKINELQLILFLHSCYYKLEPTKTCIENFYTVRGHCPEFFSKRNPKENHKEVIDLVLYRPLELLTPNEGYKVIYARLINTDVDKYSFPTQVKAFDMASMLMLHLEGTHKGLIIVTDMQGATFAHLTKLNPLHLKKFFFYLQDCMPVRMKGLHFINIPSWIDKLMALIKPFMKKELLEVLQLHSDLETLYKYVPQSCLPKDYGGNAESFQELAKKQRKLLLENADYFIEEEKLITDESKRPGKPKNAGDIFGVEGSFKKLNID
nr:alpha-tocopherol transfer protein-like [Onthophagus taurus]